AGIPVAEVLVLALGIEGERMGGVGEILRIEGKSALIVELALRSGRLAGRSAVRERIAVGSCEGGADDLFPATVEEPQARLRPAVDLFRPVDIVAVDGEALGRRIRKVEILAVGLAARAGVAAVEADGQVAVQ